jgi:hypothetical protein
MASHIRHLLPLTGLLTVAAAPSTPAVAQQAVLELDHAYLVVPPGAAAAIQALRQAGIHVDTETVRHDGEGTTSIAAFFENAYLELLWVDSSVTVDSAHQRDLTDFRRAASWRETGASPFGIGLHFQAGSPADLGIPFRLDPIPDTQPPAAYVLLRQPAESLAPDVFIMPDDRAVTTWLDRFRRREPEQFAHPAGFHRMTRVIVHTALGQYPASARLDLRRVRFADSPTAFLEVEFDDGVRGQIWDLRPRLPLILSH